MASGSTILHALASNLALGLAYPFALISIRRWLLRRSLESGWWVSVGVASWVFILVAMHIPIEIQTGVTIDNRTPLIAVAGFVGGLPAGLLAMVPAVILRLLQGGIGAFPGTGAIVTAALLGGWFHRLYRKYAPNLHNLHAFALGFLVGLAGLTWTFAIGDLAAALRLVSVMAVPVLVEFSFACWILMELFVIELRNDELALAISESRENFRQLAENIKEVFWSCSSDWKTIYYLSPGFSDIWGFPSESATRDPARWLSSVVPEDRDKVNDVLDKMMRAPQENPVVEFPEFRIRRPDGEERWIYCRAFPVMDRDGQVRRIVGLSEDITRRKEIESHLRHTEKMQSIGQLAGGIAHDFNNQLAGILGNAELLLETIPEGTPEHASVRRIILSAQRSSQLTQQLLAFARRGRLRKEAVDLHLVIQDVVGLLVHSIDKRIRIEVEPAAECATTYGDPSLLQNALLNLGLNARDAMPQGGVLTIATEIVTAQALEELKSEFELGHSEYVCVRVGDTGVGIESGNLQKIFEPFFTTKERGNGMGLAAVYGTVRAHGGAVRLTSRPGEGSEFILYFPLYRPEFLPTTEPMGRSRYERAVARVFVVDDESHVLDLITRVLVRAGHAVTPHTTPTRALQDYRASWRDVDLVILDVLMPELTGPELLSQMRAINPSLRAIFVSGYEGGRLESDPTDANVLFLAKPFAIDKLLETVDKALGKDLRGVSVSSDHSARF